MPKAKPAKLKTKDKSSDKAKDAVKASDAVVDDAVENADVAAESSDDAPTPAVKPAKDGKESKEVKMTPFLKRQEERLLILRDDMLDAMMGVSKDTLRSRAEGSEASAFGMHQADAGSDAYDRDFALSLLSQEQDALYEIEEALKRIEQGTYGICEMSGKAIMQARLEALPFARFTVECQAQYEKQRRASRSRVPVTSLFGLTDSEGEDSADEEEESSTDNNKD